MQVDSSLAGLAAGAAGLVCVIGWLVRRRMAALTERAEMAARLAAARGRWLSLAAHELRSPGLSLLAEASRAMPRDPSQGDALEALAQQVLRLSDDLAQFATGPTVRRLEDGPAALGTVVDGAIAVVAAQIRPGRRHWHVDPSLRALTLKADRRALEGALAALLRRAARHSRDGDAVALRYVSASETIAIVVEDEGDGLPALDMAAEASAPPGGTRGLDLGLSLARSLAAAHGGDIKLESAPGIGARAWLTLPRTRLLEAA
jgi:signal transduction histidine kinase